MLDVDLQQRSAPSRNGSRRTEVVTLSDPNGSGQADGDPDSAVGAGMDPVLVPLESGRTWVKAAAQLTVPGSNRVILIEDLDEPSVRAFFKWPNSKKIHSCIYSLGLERVYYELAHPFELPICETYLETFGGQAGVVSIRAPGAKAWATVKQDIVDARASFIDRDIWPLVITLDVLLGNYDRHGENIFVQWDPPN